MRSKTGRTWTICYAGLLLSPLVLGRNSAHTAAARNLAFAYASMRSNCLLGTGEDDLDYGIRNLEEAHKGLRLAIVAPDALSSNAVRFQSLVFALFIDRAHDEQGRHYAAARLIQPSSDAWGGRARERDQLVQQLSRRTIIEAQKTYGEARLLYCGDRRYSRPAILRRSYEMVQLLHLIDRGCGGRRIMHQFDDGSLSRGLGAPLRTRSLAEFLERPSLRP